MALRRTHYIKSEDQFTLDFGPAEDGTEQKLNVIWNPRKYTPALERRVEAEQRTTFQSGMLPTFLADLLIDWDLVDFEYEHESITTESGDTVLVKTAKVKLDGDGNPIERKVGVTYDEIAEQPLELLMEVLEGCVARIRPKKRSS